MVRIPATFGGSPIAKIDIGDSFAHPIAYYFNEYSANGEAD